MFWMVIYKHCFLWFDKEAPNTDEMQWNSSWHIILQELKFILTYQYQF